MKRLHPKIEDWVGRMLEAKSTTACFGSTKSLRCVGFPGFLATSSSHHVCSYAALPHTGSKHDKCRRRVELMCLNMAQNMGKQTHTIDEQAYESPFQSGCPKAIPNVPIKSLQNGVATLRAIHRPLAVASTAKVRSKQSLVVNWSRGTWDLRVVPQLPERLFESYWRNR